MINKKKRDYIYFLDYLKIKIKVKISYYSSNLL